MGELARGGQENSAGSAKYTRLSGAPFAPPGRPPDRRVGHSELYVIDAGYRHDWREQRLSDHSAAFADLERTPAG